MTEYCFGFVEDAPSAAIAKKLVTHTNEESEKQLQFRDGFPVVKGGMGNIRKQVDAYVNMAKSGQCAIVLVDLDVAPCAPTLLREWFAFDDDADITLPEPLVFRVAVREIESWIMADRSNLARFLKIPIGNFPREPDGLSDPKQRLLSIIRRKGQKKWHREMLPQGPTASIGPAYNERLCAFIEGHWSPDQAAQNSASLRKAIAALAQS